MQQIVSHLTRQYAERTTPKQNGAYWYSKEIYENIIPHIKTKRPWVLINIPYKCYDHAIVFIHSNLNPIRYIWLSDYKDLILVCSQHETVDKMIKWFPQSHIVYLPLSIDVKYVSKFKRKRKTKEIAFAGRLSKCPKYIDQQGIDILGGIEREDLLKELGKYKKVYAVGRCALEARCLGCEILPYDPRYPDDRWHLYDNKDVIPMLQNILNEIDGTVV